MTKQHTPSSNQQTSSVSSQNNYSNSLAEEIAEELDEIEELTDSEGEDEFIRRYGDINFQYIKRPKDAVWFIRPHALNYFKDGVLYRTKGERTAAKTELFLDLMYVGIVANLAGEACEDPSGKALAKYILLFIPAWTVWADIKDFTNYYYNEDLSQKIYIFWILCLLTLFVNSHGDLLKDTKGAALTIVPYMLCRLSLATSFFVYSFFIPEHRKQQRLYSFLVLITCCLWIPVIFIPTRAKIGLGVAIMFLEQLSFALSFHPFTKKVLGVTMSTALNIEHEVERMGTFVTIALGEFLYKVVANGPLGPGFSAKFLRGIFLVWISYVLFWIYNYGSTSKKATHPLRHSANRAILWIFVHLPLVAALVLAADAGGDLIASDFTSQHSSKDEGEEIGHNIARYLFSAEVQGETGVEGDHLYGLSFFFTGGICVALLSMCALGLLDKSKDPKGLHVVSKFWRVIWRAPVGIVIVCLSFAKLNTTLLMGIVVALQTVLLIYESIVSTPQTCLPDYLQNTTANSLPSDSS